LKVIDLRSDTVQIRPIATPEGLLTAEAVRGALRPLPRLAQAGVLLVAFGSRRMRAVTHLDASLADVEAAADRISEVLG